MISQELAERASELEIWIGTTDAALQSLCEEMTAQADLCVRTLEMFLEEQGVNGDVTILRELIMPQLDVMGFHDIGTTSPDVASRLMEGIFFSEPAQEQFNSIVREYCRHEDSFKGFSMRLLARRQTDYISLLGMTTIETMSDKKGADKAVIYVELPGSDRLYMSELDLETLTMSKTELTELPVDAEDSSLKPDGKDTYLIRNPSRMVDANEVVEMFVDMVFKEGSALEHLDEKPAERCRYLPDPEEVLVSRMIPDEVYRHACPACPVREHGCPDYEIAEVIHQMTRTSN